MARASPLKVMIKRTSFNERHFDLQKQIKEELLKAHKEQKDGFFWDNVYPHLDKAMNLQVHLVEFREKLDRLKVLAKKEGNY